MSTGYEIELGLASGGSTTIVDVGSELTYTQLNLEPETLYRARVRQYVDAEYSDWSAWEEVSTLSLRAPTIITTSASDVTINGTILNGELTDLGDYSSAWVAFQYGLSTAYGQTTDFQLLSAPAVFSDSIGDITGNTEYFFRATARNRIDIVDRQWYANGTSFTTGEIFTIQSDAADEITDTTVTLNGQITDFGSYDSVDVFFGYAVKSGDEYIYIEYSNPETITAGTAPIAFDFGATGLLPGQKYYFAAFGQSKTATTNGDILNFTTTGAIVETDAATVIENDSARLNGDLLSLNGETDLDVYFEWGAGFANSTTPETKSATGAFYFDVSGLSENSEYQFRACATDGTNIWRGEIKTFDTTFDVVAETLYPATITKTGAKLQGKIISYLASAKYYFEYGLDSSFGTSTTQQTITTTSASGEIVSQNITGLSEGVQYYYRLVVVDETPNPDVLYYGQAVGFSTIREKIVSSNKSGLWLFNVTSDGNLVGNWSMSDVTFDGTNYTKKVLPDRFPGVTNTLSLGNGLISSEDLTFDIDNSDFALGETDEMSYLRTSVFLVKISLVIDDVVSRVWKYRIERVTFAYGSATLFCKSLLQTYLDGDWPNTPHPMAVWPTSDKDPDPDYCIPLVFGPDAYVPVMSAYTGASRPYILGAKGPAYTINEVHAPHDRGNSTWDSGTYTFTQADHGDYRGALFEIADDGGGGYDPGYWQEGSTLLPALVQYSRSDSVDITNPAQLIEHILLDMGIPASYLDSAGTFAAAKTILHSRGMVWSGGWWKKESREKILSDMLSMCDAYLFEGEKIELHLFNRSPVEFFDKTIEHRFSPSAVSTVKDDGGTVVWCNDASPQDVFPGKALVNIDPNVTGSSNPSKTEFQYRFQFSSVNAQKAGILYFQKQSIQNRVAFTTSILDISNLAALKPGRVVTLYNPRIFKLTMGVIITSMTINYDLTVDIEAVELSYMSEWNDLSPASVAIVADTTTGNML